MPLSIGDKLGPYEIVASIGAGGFGEVYRARSIGQVEAGYRALLLSSSARAGPKAAMGSISSHSIAPRETWSRCPCSIAARTVRPRE